MTPEPVLVCAGCERALEACAFCDSEDCGEATCYRCMIVDLKETLTQPHDHGG